jgi:hypothetical protein
MKGSIDSPTTKVPILRLVAGGLLAASALGLMVFFEGVGHGGGAPGAPETARYEGGMAGYSMPLLVFAAILLFSWLPARAARRDLPDQPALGFWKAASRAIHVWAAFMAGVSVLLTTFMPGLSDAQGWAGAMDGDFPRVLINDFQENSQFSLILLAFYYAFSLYHALRGSVQKMEAV